MAADRNPPLHRVEARVAGRQNVGTSVRACNCVYMTDSQAAERRQIYVAPMELTLLLSPLINTLLRTCLRSVDPLRGPLTAKAYGKADSDPPPRPCQHHTPTYTHDEGHRAPWRPRHGGASAP